jgi:hypothetical protein
MIDSVRAQLTAILEGLGYTVKQAEITSLDDLKTLVNQIGDDEYPYCTISFGDGADVPKSDSQMVGHIEVLEDFNINTIYYADREELPAIREAETRKIRDAIFDYLISGTNEACDWYIDTTRRAFLPAVRANQKPAGGLAIQTKVKYIIQERS